MSTIAKWYLMPTALWHLRPVQLFGRIDSPAQPLEPLPLPPPMPSFIFDAAQKPNIAEFLHNDGPRRRNGRQIFLASFPDRLNDGDTENIQDLIPRLFIANSIGFSVVKSPELKEMFKFLPQHWWSPTQVSPWNHASGRLLHGDYGKSRDFL